jgi:hypothetical protein
VNNISKLLLAIVFIVIAGCATEKIIQTHPEKPASTEKLKIGEKSAGGTKPSTAVRNTVKLNFINRSNDVSNTEVVIFQKNVATDFEELALAWIVIKNCGQGDNHSFTFPSNSEVSASDSYGNYTPQLIANPGDSFDMVQASSGHQLVKSQTPSAAPSLIEIRNNLQQGAIKANIFKDGKLLAIKTGIVPAQKAVFRFKPTIFIGVLSQVEEGQVINSAILEEINTEISLLGLASADIVMTGGGTGPSATAFQFNLQNVRMK